MNKRKMILGIALVVCLDIAFILSIMVDFNSNEIAKAVDFPAVEPSLITRNRQASRQPELDTSEPETGSVRNTQASERYDIDDVRRPRPTGTVDMARRPKFAVFEPYESADQFQDTVIFYERKDDEVKSEPEQVEKKETNIGTGSVTKKKSFASKALPVIKKPYDWLKALASKFK